ncbi:MAG TPA: glutaredoxin domain-containing protein [Planctomycetota bacterium]|jgi:monothiol glutaredoxin|nr:glutaredoxin domain-containing protein [Planctomycetota bacterium]
MNTEQIKQTVENHQVVVFAKGTKFQPMCGFSAHAMEILNRTGRPYEVVNIFDEEDTRANLIGYSSWPTTPQVFIGGQLVGGSDIVEEEFDNGALQKRLEAAFGS